jgi:hypothetical protein
MPNLRLYYKSDYKIRETFKTQGGETIDPRNFNFIFTFIAGKENTFTCSHTIGAEKEWVNCVYDLENNAVLCMLDNHNLLPGLLKRELTIEEPDSDFPDNKLDYITFKAYEIELIDTTDGDSLYDIYDEEIVVAIGKVNPVELAEILHESETKDAIIDADEVNYLDSANNFSLVKTTWLNIKAKLKTYFDAIYATINHNHNNVYEPANENIQSHIGDGDIHVTSLQKSDFHAHTNKTALDAVDGVNTGDQSSSDFDIKDLSDTTSLRSTWSGKQDALTFSTNIETDKASTTKVSAIKTFYDWATGKFISLSKLVTTWTATTLDTNVPSEKLVKDSLNLKADISPANGSTSALRALFIARSWTRAASGGAERYELTYNATSGYYEMYGITNLTESDVLEIYNASLPLASHSLVIGVATMEGVFAYRTARTHFPLAYFASYYQAATRYFAQGNVKFEKFIFEGFYGGLAVGNATNMFTGCTLLNEVRTLDLQYITNVSNVANIFLNCSSLVTCYVKKIKVSLSFGSSPLLSLASLQYLVTNRANGTTRITITVHATVWGYLNDAVGHPTWNALLVDAVNNQHIDFASA